MRYLSLFFLLPAMAHGLEIRVPYWREVLPKGGSVNCFYAEAEKFGFQISRGLDNSLQVAPIVEGVVSQEKATAVQKDYGDPFTIYIAYESRVGDFASHYEFLISQKMDWGRGGHIGSYMYTEAYHSKNDDGKDEVELKPVLKKTFRCR